LNKRISGFSFTTIFALEEILLDKNMGHNLNHFIWVSGTDPATTHLRSLVDQVALDLI
jgi:hypothetical protein